MKGHDKPGPSLGLGTYPKQGYPCDNQSRIFTKKLRIFTTLASILKELEDPEDLTDPVKYFSSGIGKLLLPSLVYIQLNELLQGWGRVSPCRISEWSK